MQKRILSLVLALAMVVCMVPSVGITVFASEDEKTDVVVDDKENNLENNNEVTTEPEAKPEGEETGEPEVKPESPEAPEAAPVAPEAVPFTDIMPMAATEAVAKIGETEYETFDEAIAATQAKEPVGDIIKILKDCSTSWEKGQSWNKSFTIDGDAHTVTLSAGFCVNPNTEITFNNVTVNMNEIKSGHNGDGPTPLYAIVLNSTGALTVKNHSKLNIIKGSGDGIYGHPNVKINVLDNSLLNIVGCKTNGIVKDNGIAEINIFNNSELNSNENGNGGITNTWNVTAKENSRLNVLRNKGNGSNGSNFYFYDSAVNFLDNGGFGLSATVLESTNTPITANENGYDGIIARRVKFVNCNDNNRIQANNNGWAGIRIGLDSKYDHKLEVKNSDLIMIKNGYYKETDTYPGFRLQHVVGGTMDGTSTLTVRETANNGIRLYGGSDFTIEEGAEVDITENLSDLKGGNGQGGGIRLMEGSKLVLPSDAKLYNNHAEKSGDDIYMGDAGSEITFGTVGNEWYLDGIRELDKPGCEDKIDGWYIDGENDRWDAHSNPTNIVLFDDHYDQSGNKVKELITYTGAIGLKAAHGINTENPPVDPENPPVKPEKPEWKHSKSKVATNLDENFESEVTLGLPSAEEELVSDIVFVLDKSTSADLEDQALEMLTNLKDRIAETGAKVKVGVVIFNKEAHVTEFKDLATEYEAIKTAITEKISSGTNTHAGMLAGKNMLDADTSVDASRKHLIFVSDGITYIFNKEPTSVAWNGITDNKHLGDGAIWSNNMGAETWKLKYDSHANVPEDWAKYLGDVKALIEKQGTKYDYPYGGTIVEETPKKAAEYKNYAMCTDKALYYTYLTYQECMKAGYNCYSMVAGTNSGEEKIWGPSYMKYLAGISCGEDVTFDDIEKEIVYFLDAGSKVKDVIGYGKDNKGNDYNFDFVKDVNKLTLKVGNDVLKVKEIEALDGETKCYGFFREVQVMDGYFEYPFVLHYYANGVDGKSDECFIWDINEAIENFRPVQLTYTVKLTNPQTKGGVYGEFDTDGSEDLEALLTNVEAVLFPVDSNGVAGEPEEFNKPTVAYEVEENSRPKPKPRPNDDDDDEEKKPRPYPIIKPEQIPSTGAKL